MNQPEEMPALSTAAQADLLTLWARGDAPPQAPRVMVSEAPDAAGWLAGSGLVDGDSAVFVRQTRRSGPLPDGPGHWLPFSGGAAEPGDEFVLRNDFYLQTTEYASLRYLSIAGPTVVRLTEAEDAERLLDDVDHALASGELPGPLTHPLVELGDRCALRDGHGCSGARLHIDTAGVVRTSPVGEPIGRVGDAALRDGGCVLPEVAAVLAPRLGEVAAFAAALDAVRTINVRERDDWRVSGFGARLVEDGHPFAHRDDLLLLSTVAGRCVLYVTAQRRAFVIQRPAAELIEVMLTSDDDATAAGRLERHRGGELTPAMLAGVRGDFGGRGIDLSPRVAVAA